MRGDEQKDLSPFDPRGDGDRQINLPPIRELAERKTGSEKRRQIHFGDRVQAAALSAEEKKK